uniref:Uncharacterized protein n=1 Tax=Coccolithus braarudii TaxID=221442 RepID=A0A7S0Q5W2_9EUKA
MLLLLYLLLQAGYHVVLLVLVVLFVLAGANALTLLVYTPLRKRLAKLLGSGLAYSSLSLGPLGVVDLPLLLAGLPALALALLWFFTRRGPWAWLLQDLFGACVCFVFLRSLRLPSLRVAALLLSLMFAYDIFMVFLSPMLFHHSVMMSVATAGEPSATVSVSGECERYEGERMPMLFMIPRVGASAGEEDYAMLGLGDVVVPGLLLTLAARADLMDAHRIRSQAFAPSGSAGLAVPPLHSYWALSVVGYALGLLLALLANTLHITVNGVAGQPALLYLVPCTLGVVAARAHLKGQLPLLWSGSLLDLPLSCEGGEVQPHSPIDADADTQQSPTGDNAEYNPML